MQVPFTQFSPQPQAGVHGLTHLPFVHCSPGLQKHLKPQPSSTLQLPSLGQVGVQQAP
jgi:hypothetical protein